MTLMIVDDNQKMRAYISELIRNEGDTIIECCDGEFALDLFTEHHPDWVLMDIKMEKVNGIEATRRIVNEFPEAKIIVLTSYDIPTYRKAAMEAGAASFFSKRNLLELKESIQK
ncbi:MAG: response regulator transcription factor [Ignavibacteria bacterium]|jgi:NarL family two-component system response regulator LiaR